MFARPRRVRSLWLAVVAGLLCLGVPEALTAQPASPGQQVVDRQTYERGRKMLEQLRKDLRENYYDSTFHGVDLDAKFVHADSVMRSAPSATYVFGALGQFLANLEDSHTNFIPPSKVAEVDYGFRVQFVGDTCFVVSVRPESDAAAQGLKRGDALLQFDRFRVERQSWPTLAYVYYRLSPRPALTLLVRSPAGVPRPLTVQAKVTMGERIVDLTDLDTRRRLTQEYEDDARRPRHYWREIGDSVFVWKMPSFIYGDESNIDHMFDKARAHRTLILDLRNDGGGSVDTQKYLLGAFFDRDTVDFTMLLRKAPEVQRTKLGGRKPYTGKVIVLINSNSASASEITSRALQLMGRATIVGDRSMGAVVTSRTFVHDVGFERVVSYGAQVSVADVVMPDGARLEGHGVVPDVLVLPTGEDIAARRDPQLAKALELAGVTRDPSQAAMLFREP